MPCNIWTIVLMEKIQNVSDKAWQRFFFFEKKLFERMEYHGAMA